MVIPTVAGPGPASFTEAAGATRTYNTPSGVREFPSPPSSAVIYSTFLAGSIARPDAAGQGTHRGAPTIERTIVWKNSDQQPLTDDRHLGYTDMSCRPFAAGDAVERGALEVQDAIVATVERPVIAIFETIGELSLLLSRTVAHIL